MQDNYDLLNAFVGNIIIKLDKKPEQRYGDLKKNVGISDATLSSKLKLLKAQDIIKTSATKNKIGRVFIVYSLTTKGVSIAKALKLYLRLCSTNK